MANKSDLKLFAGGGGANVMTQAEYEAMAALPNGFSSGVAQAPQLNKVWRQASFVAAMIGQFTMHNAIADVLDDGNVDGFEAKFKAAVQALVTAGFPYATAAEVVAAAIADKVVSPKNLAPAVQGGSWNYAVASGTANALTASLTPALEAYTPGLEIRFVPSAVNTDSATLKVGSLAALPIVRNGGYPLRAGDLKAGRLSIGHVSADATVIELVANNQDIPPPGSGLTGSQNYIGWSPAAAASRDLTATFTAPSTGLVLAISTLNKSVLSTENRNVVNTIYINGVQGPGDGVNSGSTVIMTTTATPGQPFTIISRITVDAGGSSAMSNYLTYLFIPA